MQRNDLQAIKFSHFSLNRFRPKCYYPPTNVDFSCRPNNKPSSASALPIFNHDLNYFTPAFVLSNQQESLPQNLAAERRKFQEKMRDQEEQVDGENKGWEDMSLRSSMSKYCLICKERFENYWRHTAEKNHQRKLTKNCFNADIQQLCRSLNPVSPPHSTSQDSKSELMKGPNLQSKEALFRYQSQLMKLGLATHSTQIVAEGFQL